MSLVAAAGRIIAVPVRFAKDHSHQEYASDCYRNVKFDFCPAYRFSVPIQLIWDVNGFLDVFQLSHDGKGHDDEQRP